MKQIKIIFTDFKTLIFLMSLIGFGPSAYAVDEGCWVDLYQQAPYKGKHIRLKGPVKLKNLLKVKGENWDKKIESIVVGPTATLTVFENKNFKLTYSEMINHPVLMKSLGITKQDVLEDSEMIFRANSDISSFGEYHFYHKIRSLKIDCVGAGKSKTGSATNKNCWVDIYDDTSYRGNHRRIQGPAKYANLSNVNGRNWDKKIESLVVGPKATLTVFEHKNYKLTLTEMANHPDLMKSLGITKQDILENSEIIFRANSKIHGLGGFQFYHKIRSLKVECKR